MKLTGFKGMINLILPIGFIIYGFLYYKFASKKLSNFFGYKTSKTQLSQETWEYGNKRVGEIWMKLGGLYTLIVLLLFLIMPSTREKASIIVVILALVVSFVPFSIVEKEIKEKFDEEGKAK